MTNPTTFPKIFCFPFNFSLTYEFHNFPDPHPPPRKSGNPNRDTDYRLETLEGYDSNLVQYKWIVGRNRQRLVQEPLGQFGIVRQSILQTNVQQRQVTPAAQNQQYGLSKATGSILNKYTIKILKHTGT